MKNAREFKNYKNAVASREVILLTTVGSTALGLESENSDIDEMGICIETPEDLLGFSTFEQTIYRTAQDRTGKFDAKSEAGDIDLTIYGLRKYVRLSLGGNPNLITLLFMPRKLCSTYTTLAADLQALRDHFVAKSTLKAFLGYAKAQRIKLAGSRDTRSHAYDLKYAMHFVRLMMQGYELGSNGTLSFPMPEEYLRKLRAIRRGDYTFGDVIDSAHSYERALEALLHESNLPEGPNYKAIEKWLLGVYNAKWQGEAVKPATPAPTVNTDPNIQF